MTEHKLDVKITRYNKLVINYDTYELSPSNNKHIEINNPWYVDTSSAPDFVGVIEETNNYSTVTVPEDKYSISNYKVARWYNGGDVNKISFSAENVSHADMIKKFVRSFYEGEIDYIPTSVGKLYEDDYYMVYYPGNVWCTHYQANDTTTEQNILCPVSINNYHGNHYTADQAFPLIKTITITINSNHLQMDLDEHDVVCINSTNGKTTTIHFPKGTYTASEYCNKLGGYSFNEIYVKGYNYMPNCRLIGSVLRFSGDYITNTVAYKLLCVKTNNSEIHHTLQPANNRCIHVTPGEVNLHDMINTVNNSNVDFTLSSDNHYIYVNCDMPFIINPVCSIVNENTDISETFATSHVLMKHPMYKEINCTVTHNGVEYICNGDYTPAEFLIWITDKTGVKFNVNGDVITYNEILTVTDNPFFQFETPMLLRSSSEPVYTVTNLCNMSTTPMEVTIVRNQMDSYKSVDLYEYNGNTYNKVIVTSNCNCIGIRQDGQSETFCEYEIDPGSYSYDELFEELLNCFNTYITENGLDDSCTVLTRDGLNVGFIFTNHSYNLVATESNGLHQILPFTIPVPIVHSNEYTVSICESPCINVNIDKSWFDLVWLNDNYGELTESFGVEYPKCFIGYGDNEKNVSLYVNNGKYNCYGLLMAIVTSLNNPEFKYNVSLIDNYLCIESDTEWSLIYCTDCLCDLNKNISNYRISEYNPNNFCLNGVVSINFRPSSIIYLCENSFGYNYANKLIVTDSKGIPSTPYSYNNGYVVLYNGQSLQKSNVHDKLTFYADIASINLTAIFNTDNIIDPYNIYVNMFVDGISVLTFADRFRAIQSKTVQLNVPNKNYGSGKHVITIDTNAIQYNIHVNEWSI